MGLRAPPCREEPRDGPHARPPRPVSVGTRRLFVRSKRSSSPPSFADATSAPRRPTRPHMLAAIGAASLDALDRGHRAGEHRPPRRRCGCPPPSARPRRWPSSRRIAAKNRLLKSFIGQGYHGTPHARRHPAQHPGEPRLVHRLHALPGRDQPGPDGGAGQLPDHGLRPHRHGDRQRLAARRGHRRRRGDDAGQAHASRAGATRVRRRRGDCHPQTHRGAPHARRAAGHRGASSATSARARSTRRRLLRRARAVPRHRRRDRTTCAAVAERVHARQAACHRRRRPAGADAAHAAGRMGRRHRGRHHAALRRADGLRRPARRLPGLPRRVQALACPAAWWA